MRKWILFMLSCTSSLCVNAQSWSWGKAWNGSGINDGACDIARDSSGNLYLTGYYDSSTIIFGNDTLVSSGGLDIFVAKLDSSGIIIWAKRYGGAYADISRSIQVDKEGNIFISGWFGSPVIAFGSNILTNAGGADVFLAKLNSSGNIIWAARGGGSSNDDVFDLTLDKDGNPYLTGFYSSNLCVFGSYSLVNQGYDDVFITKYDSSGTVLWAISIGGSEYEEANGIAINDLNEIYVTGFYQSDSLVVGQDTLWAVTASLDNLFVIKFDPLGNPLWANSPSYYGWGASRGEALDVSGSGSVYVAGEFTGNIIFGNDTLMNAGIGWSDVCLLKFDSGGNILWTRSGKGGGDDNASAICLDKSENIYVSGVFSHLGTYNVQFGTQILSYPGSGSQDPLFVVRYDSSGTVLCADELTSGGVVNSVASDDLGNAYVCGSFAIDPFVVGPDVLNLADTMPAQTDIFLAKYSCGTINGIEDKVSDHSILIYPNPNNGSFHIEVEGGENVDVEIYNTFGQLILEKQYRIDNNSIKIEDLADGVYMVRLIVDGIHNKSQRIIVTK